MVPRSITSLPSTGACMHALSSPKTLKTAPTLESQTVSDHCRGQNMAPQVCSRFPSKRLWKHTRGSIPSIFIALLLRTSASCHHAEESPARRSRRPLPSMVVEKESYIPGLCRDACHFSRNIPGCMPFYHESGDFSAISQKIPRQSPRPVQPRL